MWPSPWWPSPWRDFHPDVTFAPTWPSPWYDLRPDVTFALMWRSPWCDLHVDVTFALMSPSLWCDLHLDVTFAWMWPSPGCDVCLDVTFVADRAINVKGHWVYPYIFVSALYSDAMGRHKYYCYYYIISQVKQSTQQRTALHCCNFWGAGATGQGNVWLCEMWRWFQSIFKQQG